MFQQLKKSIREIAGQIFAKNIFGKNIIPT